jgi:tryptophan synthase alpha chain
LEDNNAVTVSSTGKQPVETRPASPHGSTRIEASLRSPTSDGVAVAAFLTAGFPTRERFPRLAAAIAPVVDVLEIGIPFTDPMADGRTIQRTSEVALRNGVTLPWILDTITALDLKVPVVVMGYLNPLLAYGVERFATTARTAGVSGVIIPDLPLESSEGTRQLCDAAGLALVQLVTPTTDADRIERICGASRGFVYAVATTGITGGATETDQNLTDYLDRVRQISSLPVLAGFGIRTSAQVDRLRRHCDGVVIGSALLEVIETGQDPVQFIANILQTNSPDTTK